MHMPVEITRIEALMAQGPNLDLATREQAIAELRQMLDARVHMMQTLRAELHENEQMLDHLRKSIENEELALAQAREQAEQRDEEADRSRSYLKLDSADTPYQVWLAMTLANCAYDALLVLNDAFEIIAVNDAAALVLGQESLLGRTIGTVTGKPELEALVEDALANEEETLEEQVTIGRQSYRARVKMVRFGDRQYIGVALQNVTELVRLNRARRDMVANISHELRTPIANIRLTIDSLFHEQDKPKRKQSTSALRAIARETDALLWLVQELLDLSMIESGQAILRMVDTSLNQLVLDAIERMEEMSAGKDLLIVSEVPDETKVLADGDMIRRVLNNLIHNAIKWSPQGGRIIISAEQTSADELTVSVRDQGPGVPDEHTERIFERFFQVDASRSMGEGTGLGLAICKHIIEAHGGRIWAEGNQGGTQSGCFRFTLPLAESAG
jgi:two-component system phosphate regulon sensor histidine kinase PhoR